MRVVEWVRRTLAVTGCYILSAALVCPVSSAGSCVGDCDRDGRIATSELIRGVGIILGQASVGICPVLDRDGSGVATIEELLAAVTMALRGCPRDPTSTTSPTGRPTPEATATGTPVLTSTPNRPPVISLLPIYRTFPGFPIVVPLGGSDPDGVRFVAPRATFPAERRSTSRTASSAGIPPRSRWGCARCHSAAWTPVCRRSRPAVGFLSRSRLWTVAPSRRATQRRDAPMLCPR